VVKKYAGLHCNDVETKIKSLVITIRLQTLQQLKDVYGDSVDKIVQGNASNIVFLKSTDDDMLKTLETAKKEKWSLKRAIL